MKKSSGLATDSLAFALLGATRVCLGVRNGRSLRDGLDHERGALETAPKARPVARARAASRASDPIGAIHDLSARALRRRGRADALLAVIADRIPEPPLLRELLVVAIALLVDALDEHFALDASFEARVAGLPYAPFTLVDQAVGAAASSPELARGKNFVNAVLRNLLRRMQDAPATLIEVLRGESASDEARHELPSWWVTRLADAYPGTWRDIVTSSLETPPLVVRVNCRESTRDAYLQRLAEDGVAATPVGPSAVRFERAMPVSRIPGFPDGVVSVQDEAAQRAGFLLDVRDGMRVLDACAAPGGKTGHMLELADLDLIAIDADASRLTRVKDNLDRLGLSAGFSAGLPLQLIVGDAARPERWWDGRRFDRILVDVPCTASGILRRHPDIRWLRREDDIAKLSRAAQQITDALWSLLDPDGKLLLVTCSVFPEESVRHAHAFAARHADARALAAPGQLLPVGNAHAHTTATVNADAAVDHDGLFFALFEKMR